MQGRSFPKSSPQTKSQPNGLVHRRSGFDRSHLAARSNPKQTVCWRWLFLHLEFMVVLLLCYVFFPLRKKMKKKNIPKSFSSNAKALQKKKKNEVPTSLACKIPNPSPRLFLISRRAPRSGILGRMKQVGEKSAPARAPQNMKKLGC